MTGMNRCATGVKPLSGTGSKHFGFMKGIKRIGVRLVLSAGAIFGLSDIAASHSGVVDGYGCHRGSDKVSYHCHQGQFAGRTFKSKEDFLRELRGGKSTQLSPKNNPTPPQKKNEDSPAR